MKLAEALSIRADLQKKVAQLKERIKESAKVQEGDEPCDNVEELYKELDDVLVQLEDLIYRINITNVQIVQDGDSLTRLIAKRDVLSMRVKALKEVVNYVAANDTRFGRNVSYHLLQGFYPQRQDVSLGYQSSQGVSTLNYLNVGDVNTINQIFQLNEYVIQFLVQFLHVIARFIALLYLGAFLDTFFQLSHFLLQIGSDAQCFC